MLLIFLKLPFLLAAYLTWRNTGNDKWAAGVWGFGSFAMTLFLIGFSGPVALYGIVGFLLAWALFFGLSFLEGSVMLLPAFAIGSAGLLYLS